ncbi:unnamed protein product [Leptidea sinapis]|uniref:Uncharacterized protein n=1 Tax=Leptidea sinapis TaxID=189913 RepID=A0A5E4Q0D9_9NEOP|nr:unnamed protein product [Leptidea sinapis]
MFTSAGGHVFRSGHPQHGVRGAAGHVNHHITHRDRDRRQSDESDALPYRDVRNLYQATEFGSPQPPEISLSLQNMDERTANFDRTGRMVVKWGKGENGVKMPWQLEFPEDSQRGSAPSSIDPQLTFSVRNGYGNI